MTSVSWQIGQAVRWPWAPGGVAQIVELRRSTVRLFYAHGTGLARQPIVDAIELARIQETMTPLLPLSNPYGRAILKRRSKVFTRGSERTRSES